MPLGDYKILRKLGQGAQGTVYQALHVVTNTIFVIKKIDVSSLTEKEKQAALLEVRILSTLKGYPHPYIMGYVESFVDHNEAQLCLVLQWSSQGTLQDRYDESQLENKERRQHQQYGHHITGVPFLTETELWRVFLSTVIGLHHLHSLGILHRDVKLGNVFIHSSIDEERPQVTGMPEVSDPIDCSYHSSNTKRKPHLSIDRVQIGDFGVSTILSNERSKALTMVGTPYYLSPELCMGKSYSSKTDIWSLGVLLYAMLFQRMPFQASNYGALILKIVQQDDVSTMAAMGAAKSNVNVSTVTADLTSPYLYAPILPKLCSWCLQRKDSSRPSAIDIISHPACLAKSLELGLLIPTEILTNNAVMASISRAGRLRIPPSNDVRVAVRKQLEEQEHQISNTGNNPVPESRRGNRRNTNMACPALPKSGNVGPRASKCVSDQVTKCTPHHPIDKLHFPIIGSPPSSHCRRSPIPIPNPITVKSGKSRHIKGLVCYAPSDPSQPHLKLIYRSNKKDNASISSCAGPCKADMKYNLASDEQLVGDSGVYISRKTREKEVELVRTLPDNGDATSSSDDGSTEKCLKVTENMKGISLMSNSYSGCSYQRSNPTASAPRTSTSMTVLQRMRVGRETMTDDTVELDIIPKTQEVNIPVPLSRDHTVNLDSGLHADHEVLGSPPKRLSLLGSSSEPPTVYIPCHGEEELHDCDTLAHDYTGNREILYSSSSRFAVGGCDGVKWRVLDSNGSGIALGPSGVLLHHAPADTDDIAKPSSNDSNTMNLTGQHQPIPVSRLIGGYGSIECDNSSDIREWGEETDVKYEPINVKILSSTTIGKIPSQVNNNRGHVIAVSSPNNNNPNTSQLRDLSNPTNMLHCCSNNRAVSSGDSTLWVHTLDSLDEVQLLLKDTLEEGETLAGSGGLFNELVEVFSGQALRLSDVSDRSRRESTDGTQLSHHSHLDSRVRGGAKDLEGTSDSHYSNVCAPFSQTQTQDFLRDKGIINAETQRKLIYLAFQHIFLTGQRRKLTEEALMDLIV